MSAPDRISNGWDRVADLARAVIEHDTAKTGPLSALERHRLTEAERVASLADDIRRVMETPGLDRTQRQKELSALMTEQCAHTTPLVNAVNLSPDRDQITARAYRSASERQFDETGAIDAAREIRDAAASRGMEALQVASRAKEILHQLDGMREKAQMIVNLIEREAQTMHRLAEQGKSAERTANEASYQREREYEKTA